MQATQLKGVRLGGEGVGDNENGNSAGGEN